MQTAHPDAPHTTGAEALLESPSPAQRSSLEAHFTWSSRLIWLALVLVSIGHAAHYLPFIADDALISLRYAERLLNGEGLTWTAGSPVEGYSNLAWTLGIASLGLLGVDLIDATRILGVGSVALTLWILLSLVKTLIKDDTNPRGHRQPMLSYALGGLAFALAPAVGVWSIGGLEATLFTCALLGYLVGSAPLISTQRPLGSVRLGAPYWGALLCLTRPDGPLFIALWGVFFGITRFIARRHQTTLEDHHHADHHHEKSSGAPRAQTSVWSMLRPGLMMVLIPMIATLAQVLIRRAYYGEWVPNTAHLKTYVSMETISWGAHYWGGVFKAYWPLLALSALGLRHPRKSYVYLLLCTLLTWTLYISAVGGDIFPGHRHAVISWGLVVSLLILGGLSLKTRRSQALFTLTCLGAISYSLVVGSGMRAYQRAHAERWEWDGQVIGELLRSAFSDQDPLLAVTAAGTLPYFSKLRALDMQGLNDRHIAHQPPQSGYALAHNHGDGAYVLRQKPDLLAFRGVGRGEPMFVSGDQMKKTAEFNLRYRMRLFEGQYPYWVPSKLFVRLDGVLGFDPPPILTPKLQSAETVRIPSYLFLGGVSLPGPPRAPHRELKAQLVERLNLPPRPETKTTEMISRWPIGELIRLLKFPLSPGVWSVETDPPLPIRLNIPKGTQKTSLAFQILDSTHALKQPRPSFYKRAHQVLVRSVVLKRIGDAPRVQFKASSEMIAQVHDYEMRQQQVNARSITLHDFELQDPQPTEQLDWYTAVDATTPITRGAVKRQQAIKGQRGVALFNTFDPRLGDQYQGRWWSEPIQLSQHHILSFKIGGGALKTRVGLRLWVNGVAVSSWSGRNSESLVQHHVDLRAYPDALIQLELFDEGQGAWGHLLIDDIWLSADLSAGRERAMQSTQMSSE